MPPSSLFVLLLFLRILPQPVSPSAPESKSPSEVFYFEACRLPLLVCVLSCVFPSLAIVKLHIVTTYFPIKCPQLLYGHMTTHYMAAGVMS